MESQNATARVEKYQAWERKSLKGGLEVWSDAGFEVVYEEQLKRFKKCKTPGILRDEQLQATSQKTEAP